MPRFSKRSTGNLSSCENVLQLLANEAIKVTDFTVICGHRGKKEQDEALASGASSVRFPHSKHNTYPSQAFDFIPYPFPGWKSSTTIARFTEVAQTIKEAWLRIPEASREGWKLTWGGDWKMRDYPHIQVTRTTNE
jgi:peptidoglycan LD-endopeptidase CwlK